MNNRLEVITLVDNYPYDKRTSSEFGYSLLINFRKHKILFNTGYSNLFLQNAKKLAYDLNNLTEVVITHKHKSHSGGLPHLVRILRNKTKFLIEENFFQAHQKNVKGYKNSSDESNVLIKKYLKKHDVAFVKQGSYYYNDEIYFFLPNDRSEKKYALSKYNIRNALVMIIDTKKGLYVFMGAAHSRLSMVLDWIEKRFPNKDIEMIFGGINVNFNRESDIEIIRKALKKVKIKHFELSHCSGKDVYEFLKENVESVYFSGTGKILTFNL